MQKKELFLHYLFIFFMYLFKSVWAHWSLILKASFIIYFDAQIYPDLASGSQEKQIFLRIEREVREYNTDELRSLREQKEMV